HFTAAILPTLGFISVLESAAAVPRLSRTISILLEVRGLFHQVPYLAFPLYRNSISGNGTETRDTISAGDNIIYTILLRIYRKIDMYVMVSLRGILFV
ncbi:MAG: hypothetical protein WAL79_00465, partial [Nitrososphaeraceae archaeon]